MNDARHIRTAPLLDSRRAIVLLGVLLAIALTAAPRPAFPQPPQSRADALRALAAADAARRAEGVVWLANLGGPQDATLLHERLRDESGLVRSYAEQGLWLMWARSGDAEIDALMARGNEEMSAGRQRQAILVYSQVIERKPDFAEGWNRRATAYYLSGEYRKSIADCDEVLKRNPRHFGALSGLGQIYAKLEEYETALAWFRKALEVNPNMVGVEINIESIRQRLSERRKNAT